MSLTKTDLMACCMVLGIIGCTDEGGTTTDSTVPDRAVDELTVEAGKASDGPGKDNLTQGDVGQGDLKTTDASSLDSLQPDSAQPADKGGPQPNIKGRIRLWELQDFRINTVPKPQVQVAFADSCFYEETFSVITTHGACTLGQFVPPPPCIPHYLNGGPVTITGGDAPLSYKYKGQWPYVGNLPSSAKSVFTNGQTLTIKGGGSAKVPAKFTGTLPAPSDLKVTVPNLSGPAATVSTKADWTVKWTKASADKVVVRLRCMGGATGMPTAVECDVKDNGSVVIKASALSALAAKCSGKVDIRVERINEIDIPNPQAKINAQAKIGQTGGLILK